MVDIESSDLLKNPRFSQPIKNDEEEKFKAKSEEDYGYYLLRTNYSRVKPHSKYAAEGVRPRSPNLPYSFLSDEAVKNNPQNPKSVFHPSTPESAEGGNKNVKRHFVERSVDSYNRHLIRGPSLSMPYCYIAKDPYNNYPDESYKSSQYGAYPTWGPEETGFRTRSHFVAEPAERFLNIDMYKRPPTNQPGNIIFDHGRPNNGYYLQRHQYENTWFNSNLKLNKTNILDSIAPKTQKEYNNQKEGEKMLTRSKTSVWPFSTEYIDKFALNTKTDRKA